MSGERVAWGFEARNQRATGTFGVEFARVKNPDIDLNGWTFQGTAGIRLR